MNSLLAVCQNPCGQEVKITKTYKLEENFPTTVTDAVVILKDNLGNTYDFAEQGNKYVSVNEFFELI